MATSIHMRCGGRDAEKEVAVRRTVHGAYNILSPYMSTQFAGTPTKADLARLVEMAKMKHAYMAAAIKLAETHLRG